MDFKPESQYLAMMRAYEALRLLATDTGSSSVMGHAPADAARRFFLDCYNLKDWLKKDVRIQDPRSVELYVSGSIHLSIAADICNTFKHAGLDSPPRGIGKLDQMNVAHTLLMPAGMPQGTALGQVKMEKQPDDGDSIRLGTKFGLRRAVATARVVLTVAGKQYDAFQVATECVAAWDRFLKRSGLQFRKADK